MKPTVFPTRIDRAIAHGRWSPGHRPRGDFAGGMDRRDPNPQDDLAGWRGNDAKYGVRPDSERRLADLLGRFETPGDLAQKALGLAVSAFGLFFLLEHGTYADLGGDDVLGRPSVPTSASFVVLGCALALTPAQAPVAQFLRSVFAVGVAVLATTGVLGYFIAPIDPSVHRALFGFAMHTALAFLCLSIGVLAAGRRRIAFNDFISLAAPIVSLIALAALVATSLFALNAQFKVRTQARRAEKIEVSLSRLLDVVRDAETSQRGYLLTGAESFLDPFRAAPPQADKEFEQVSGLIDGDGEARAGLTQIRGLVEQKFEHLRQTIALKKNGDAAGALALVNSGRGATLMDRLREKISGMKDDELRRANAQREIADAQIVALQFSTLLTVSLVVALAAFLFLDGRRRFEHLRRVQRRLTFLNENLDRSVGEKTGELSAALDAARRAEESVRELNAHLEEQVETRTRELDRIFRMSADMLGVGDFDGRMIRISPACETITGRPVEQALSEPTINLVHPDDRSEVFKIFAKNLRGARLVNFVSRSLRADGDIRWLSWRITPAPQERLIFFTARDVTDERQEEEILRHAQKMEAVGQLTGGIAHDFNNLLTVVIGNLDSLQRSLLEIGPRARRQIEHALLGANRAAALTARLLAFSRRQPLAPETIEANSLVSAMSEILRRTLGEQIAVETVLAGGLWRTEADPNQLESAMLNLAINARDAMPTGGKITIETANSHLDASYVAEYPEARPGQYVMIAVADTGEGMSKEVLAKVFEPFFTTKPAGVGTGLGLSQVYGFIRQSGGHVAIESEPGAGTSVRLYLPRSHAVAREPALRRPASDAARARGESVLVVEDEEEVRAFTVETLEEAGFQVFSAAEAGAALAELEAHPRISLLVSDVVLGGPMDGRALCDEALKRRPGLPVLFMTGYTRNAILHKGRLDDGVFLLPKPFTATVLTRKVRQLLDEHQDDQLKLL